MNKPALLSKRKELRNTLTPAEAVLWKLLKGRQIGKLKFRRQQSVGPYIVDFYCPYLKLAVELDGETHTGRAEYDERRTLYLWQTAGIKVIRFENRVVFENPELILEEIEKYSTPKTLLLPEGGVLERGGGRRNMPL